jgi:Kef-type K+ transport system membrane component KefB/nucleotide-binding universal stress UspA family protein
MHGNLLLILLLQIAIILALSRAMGFVFARFKQPQVVGEMVAGIMLGPSLFAWVWPTAWMNIFRPDLIPGSGLHADPTQYLSMLSQVGVIFFLFLIGLELDPKLIQNRGHAAVVISHVSIIAPFLLGAALALPLYSQVFTSTPQMRFTSVALFMGAAMSITAFPVLARILTERNLHKTKVGAVTITCAAVDDVTAWCMLAFVVGIARATGVRSAIFTAVASLLYIGVMFFLIRPFLRRLQGLYDRQQRLSQNMVAVIFLLTLISAYATEWIGIHALFGAFLMGAVMPKGTQFVRSLSEKLEDYTVVFLLPIFFAYTGLKTQIGLLNHAELWGITFLVIAVACAGKFGGSTIAARACGLPWRESAAIGILMNTRGLMELVILNIGRELGVITDAVFAMMVIMALVTTALTTPILNWVYPERMFGPEVAAPAEAVPAGLKKLYTVLIPISDPASGGPLLRLAAMLGGTAETRRILALHLRRPVDREAYRAGLDEAEQPAPEAPALEPLLDLSQQEKIDVEPLSFVSRDIAEDISSLARARHANLVLMGFHRPVFGHAILGGTVHRVLTGAPADVAIFVNRSPDESPRKILVPYLGGVHDRLALEIANRMAKTIDVQVTAFHVVAPRRDNKDEVLGAQAEVTKAFNEPGATSPVQFKVVEHASPVDAVLAEAQNHDLVIVGVAEEWGLESQVFGFRPQRIADECPKSLLIVRKFGRGATLQPTATPLPPVSPATTT